MFRRIVIAALGVSVALSACGTPAVVGLDQSPGADGGTQDAGASDGGPAARTDGGPLTFVTVTIDKGSSYNPMSPDPLVRVGVGPDLVPQVVYFRSDQSLPTYARLNGSTWEKEDVKRSNGPMISISALEPGLAFAVDASSLPHLVYSSTSGAVIHGVRSAPSAWNITTAATIPFAIGPLPGRNSIALDQSAMPVIAYEDARLLHGGIHVIRESGVDWTDNSPPGMLIGSPDVHVDSAGFPTLLVSDDSGETNALQQSAAGWNPAYCGQYCGTARRFALDSQDRMHIIDNGLHKTWAGTTPTSNMLDDVDAMVPAALVVDHRDRVHFAYRVRPQSAAPALVKYALFDGQTNHTQVIDTDAAEGYSIDIAVDDRDRPIIVYFNATSRELRAAVPLQ
jgi:hypothetical protein